MVVYCDGGYAQSIGMLCFCIRAPTGEILVVRGTYDVVWYNNACECMGVYATLREVIQRVLKHARNYLHVKTKSAPLANYMNCTWWQREPSLSEIVEF